jgi:molybdopterin synthase sulfur carrier subunit
MIKVTVNSILSIKDVIGQREIEVSIPEKSNLYALLSFMVERWGDRLSSQLFKPGTKKVLSHIRLLVNGRDIEFMEGMNTVLQEGDEIFIFPPVSGG